MVILLAAPAAWGLSPQASAFLDKSKKFLEKKNVLSALTYFKQAQALDPEAPEIVAFGTLLRETIDKEAAEHFKAAEFYRTNSPPKAIEEYRYVLKLIPDHAEAKAGLAAMKTVERTVQKFAEQGVAMAPDSGRSHDVNALSARDLFQRAKAAYLAKNLVRAMDFIAQALARDPNFQQAVDLREQIVAEQQLQDMVINARADLTSGDYTRSIDHFSNLLVREPDRFDWRYLRGLAFFRSRRYARAIEDFTFLLERWNQVERWQQISREAKETGSSAGPPAPVADEERVKFTRADLLRFLAESFAGGGDPLKAYAVGALAGLPYVFLIRSYLSGFSWLLALMGLVAVGGVVAVVWLIRMLDALVERFPFRVLAEMVRLIWHGYGGQLVDQEARLKKLAQEASLPWFSYLAGLVAMHQAKFDEAPRQFQVALGSRGLAGRAYFFLGLARQEMKQSLGGHDFEQAFLTGMQNREGSWIPQFVRDLEEALIGKYVKKGPGSESDIRTLALRCLRE
ncbi:MAG: tetratricopeptide repeat protein [Candidatus Riflebacteria bacterium]|nr:tetratricopeptide repeat protein [Candidatus Riflebacteria bacterium]